MVVNRRSVFLVTGGSSGIGAAVGRELAKAGSRIALVARDHARLSRAAEEMTAKGGVVELISSDLRDPSAAGNVVQATLESFGQLNGLIHCAGDAPAGSLEQLTDKEWEQSFTLKLGAAVRLTRVAAPYLRDTEGAIVYVAGSAGIRPGPHYSSVGAVNAALLNFSASTALLLAPDAVRVNAVAPGPVRTPRWDDVVSRRAEEQGRDIGDIERDVTATIPRGAIASAEEVARVIVWLVSANASHVTGASVPVDGGWSVAFPQSASEVPR